MARPRFSTRTTTAVATAVLLCFTAFSAQAAISFRESETANTGAGTSAILALTPDLNTQQYDVMIAQVALRGLDVDVTDVPSGWTLIQCGNGSDGPTNVSTCAYWKVAGPTETVPYNWTFSGPMVAAGGIVSYAGVDTVDPIDSFGNSLVLPTTAVPVQSITTTEANTRLVALFVTGTQTSFLPPAGMTERYDVATSQSSASDGLTVASADAGLVAAGPTGIKIATAGFSAVSGGALLALRMPEIAFGSDNDSLAEDAGQMFVQVSTVSGGVSSLPITATVSPGGTATLDSDWTLQDTVVTIPAGSLAANFVLNLTEDDLYEFHETASLAMVSTTNANPGYTDSFTLTILDADIPTVNVMALDDSAAEFYESSGTFLFSRPDGHATDTPLAIGYSVGGSADAGDDYDALYSPALITAGNLSVQVEVVPIDDGIDEPEPSPETVTVTISGYSYITGVPDNATITIADDEPTPNLAAGNDADTEGATLVFPVSLNLPSDETIQVNWTVNHTSTTADDFSGPLSGTLTFSPGDLLQNITLYTVDDADDELKEFFTVDLSAVVGPAGFSDDSALGCLDDNDDAPTVQFLGVSTTVGETLGNGTLAVVLSALSYQEVTVDYEVTGGTASGGGVDFTLASGTLSIPAGNSSGDIAFNIVNDAVDEGIESFEVTLSNPSGATLGAQSVEPVTILDNDDPQAGFAATADSASEADGTLLVDVVLDRLNGATVTVDYLVTGASTATGGGLDHSLVGGTLTFAAADQSESISIPLVDDPLDEGNETLVVVLLDPSANAGLDDNTTFTLTITDNDDPTVSVSATDTAADEASDDGTFTFERTGDASLALTVGYSIAGSATNGVDYTLLGGSVLIPASATNATVTVAGTDDAVDEAAESVALTVLAGAGYLLGSSVGSVSLADTDVPFVSIATTDATAGETVAVGGPGTFTVTRQAADTSGALVVNYTVSGTAAPGSDYSALSGTVTIPASATSAPITVSGIDDPTVELTETVTATLVDLAEYDLGSPTVATVNLQDNDNAVVQIAATDATATEAGPTTGTFTVTRVSGDNTAPLTVDYVVGGTATSAADFVALAGSVVIPALSDSAIITVTPVDDAAVDAGETVLATLSASPGYSLGVAIAATVTITDNEVPPKVSIKALDATATEAGPTSGAFLVSRLGSTAEAITVNYLVTGTAAAGDDYDALAGTVLLGVGVASAPIPVDALDDGIDEAASETVVATLAPGAAYALGTALVATVKIADNDLAPMVWVGDDDGFADMRQGTEDDHISHYIHLSDPSALPVSVRYAVSAFKVPGAGAAAALSTATIAKDVMMGHSLLSPPNLPGDDVIPGWSDCSSTPLVLLGTSFAGTLVFPPGETICRVSVFNVDDGVTEGCESYKLALSGPTNGRLDTLDAVSNGLIDCALVFLTPGFGSTTNGEGDFSNFYLNFDGPVGSEMMVKYAVTSAAAGVPGATAALLSTASSTKDILMGREPPTGATPGTELADDALRGFFGDDCLLPGDLQPKLVGFTGTLVVPADTAACRISVFHSADALVEPCESYKVALSMPVGVVVRPSGASMFGLIDGGGCT